MEEKINLILEYSRQAANNTLLAAKTVLTIEDASRITGLTKSYLYKLTSAKLIPYYKQAKLIYFDKSEIERWMKQNRQATKAETEQAAIAYCVSNENRRRKGAKA